MSEIDTRAIDLQITLLMEPMPKAETARVLREREGVGTRVEWHSCHDIYSPRNWWRANIGTDHNRDEGGAFRRELDDAPVTWKPARNPSEDITDAWEVAESLKAFSISRTSAGQWQAWAWSGTHQSATADTAPLAICLLALEIGQASSGTPDTPANSSAQTD